jgi:1,4-dihydroxy-2-naphthoate octaprenyltransferase
VLNTAAQLLHEIVDFKKDKKISKITTTVKFGIKTSLFLFKSCLLVTILISLLFFQKFLLISLSSLVFSLYFLSIKKVKRTTRKIFKIVGIFVGILYMLELITSSFLSS